MKASPKSSAKGRGDLNCVSLFSGAGGLDIGFERAGFRTVAMNELEKAFVQTLKKNANTPKADGRIYFEGANVLEGDIRSLRGSDLSRGRKVHCVIGGPPCQAFSSAGKQRSVLDQRGQLVDEFCRVVDEVSPPVFLFENVRGLVTARDEKGRPGGVVERIFDKLQDLGYSCRAQLLNAADYGAYQRRVRCFIIGVRNGSAPLFPNPSHDDGDNSLLSRPHKTLGEFLRTSADRDRSRYSYPSDRLRAALADLPGGSGLKSGGVSEPTRPGGHWGYRQGTFIADLTKPARTVTGSASQDLIRWEGELRRLTLLEVKRLQGFPDDWEICGTDAQIFKQIGNAVPTVFGELLGNALREYLSEEHSTPPERKELPPAFRKYIEYTITDHARNKSARRVHKNFELDAESRVGE